MAQPGHPFTDQLVQTRSGPVRGVADGRIRTWKGIRYAAPPVGELRWRAPVAPEPWTDPVVTTEFGAVSPQPQSPIPMGLGTHSSEDCLFLNVWSPANDTVRPRPVMVWVHGGAYIFGSGSQPLYDGATLASDGDVRRGHPQLPTRRARLPGSDRVRGRWTRVRLQPSAA